MTAILPRLREGGHIRVIAPSRSLQVVSTDNEYRSVAALERLGFTVSFGRHVRETGFLSTAPAAARLDDLHEAFADATVDAILTVVGGTRCFDLLGGIDWTLLRANPKPLCGYSDVTVLLNAVWQMTGMVTYSGPHFSSFAMKDVNRYQASAFLSAVTGTGPVKLAPTQQWSDDTWYVEGHNRVLSPGRGWAALQPGAATGRLVGGNCSSLLLLQGTPFAPELADTILLIEDIAAVSPGQVQRSLVALSFAPGFHRVRGLIFGRFQRSTALDRNALAELLATLPDAYRGLPVLADVEAGHTQPIATFPIGGRISMRAGPPNTIGLFPERATQ